MKEQRVRKNAVCGVLALAAGMSARAQDAISFLNETNTQIRSAGSLIYEVVVGVLAIVAIISLVIVGIKMSSGDNEATQKAVGWCGGIVFCLIAAVAVKNYMGL